MALDERLKSRVQADGTEVPFRSYALWVVECRYGDWQNERTGVWETKVRLWRGVCECGDEVTAPMEQFKTAMVVDCGCGVVESSGRKYYAYGHRGPGRPRREKTPEEVEAAREALAARAAAPMIRMGKVQEDGRLVDKVVEPKKQTAFMLAVSLREKMAKAAYREGMSATAWVEMLIRQRLEYLEAMNGGDDE